MLQGFSQPVPLAVVSLLFLSACAATPMLPPDMHDVAVLGQVAAQTREAPIWPASAAEGYKRRLRLFILPPSPQRIAIRIDTDSRGETIGHAIRAMGLTSGRGWRVVQKRSFSVTPEDLDALNDLIAQSKLWQIHPQHWVDTDTNSVCVDGVQIVMERVEERQYRFSEANAQCTAPDTMLKVASKMIDLAGLSDSELAALLR